MTEKVAEKSLVPGDHGTTYGGNPLACAAISKVIDIFEEEKILDNVGDVAPYLEKGLNALVEKYDFIQEQRGLGLMRGLVLTCPVGPVISRAIEKGLILINAGANIIRFVPPLVITKEDVDAMLAVLDECLSEC